jgi:cell wall-associated NlpC family hydrolase
VPPRANRGDLAARAALAQVGKPYVWATAGPGAFDCSGLTQWAWAAAGVWLDHWTVSQWQQGVRVSSSALQRGDLVFFEPDLGHVGVYLGGGMMVDAPHAGASVRVEPVWWGQYRGAVRPTG